MRRFIYQVFTISLGLFALLINVQSQDMNNLPLVKIIATGGTIANTAQGRLSVDDVLRDIPEIRSIAKIEVRDYIRVGSSEITVQNWIDIARIITEELDNNPDIAGIVVTHGSNTSEETGYFLNLVLDTDKPVVLTAAQRQRTMYSEDSSRNFIDAVRVAAHPDAGGRGVMLVVNEMVHAVRDVTKTLSYRVETWNSGDLGAIGLTDTDMIRFYHRPEYRHTTSSELGLGNITRADQIPRVDIFYAYADAGPELVQAAVAAGAKGIVVAGFPTGGTPPVVTEKLHELEDQGIAIVMGNRGGRGRIQTNREFISADNLTPQKARILLMMALANNVPLDEIEDIFMMY
ncbi:MAG: asparaginase [Gammaproteobacteria bacterium]|nr:asparaginase [Gammaproteobacteria bacterium]